MPRLKKKSHSQRLAQTKHLMQEARCPPEVRKQEVETQPHTIQTQAASLNSNEKSTSIPKHDTLRKENKPQEKNTSVKDIHHKRTHSQSPVRLRKVKQNPPKKLKQQSEPCTIYAKGHSSKSKHDSPPIKDKLEKAHNCVKDNQQKRPCSQSPVRLRKVTSNPFKKVKFETQTSTASFKTNVVETALQSNMCNYFASQQRKTEDKLRAKSTRQQIQNNVQYSRGSQLKLRKSSTASKQNNGGKLKKLLVQELPKSNHGTKTRAPHNARKTPINESASLHSHVPRTLGKTLSKVPYYP